jgi:hypothetical protein
VQLRREARQELLAESQKHPASQLLRQIPRLGPIRVALLNRLKGLYRSWAAGPRG